MCLKYHGQAIIFSLNQNLGASKMKKRILEDIINDAASGLIESVDNPMRRRGILKYLIFM
jgi:hypothetical protein